MQLDENIILRDNASLHEYSEMIGQNILDLLTNGDEHDGEFTKFNLPIYWVACHGETIVDTHVSSEEKDEKPTLVIQDATADLQQDFRRNFFHVREDTFILELSPTGLLYVLDTVENRAIQSVANNLDDFLQVIFDKGLADNTGYRQFLTNENTTIHKRFVARQTRQRNVPVPKYVGEPVPDSVMLLPGMIGSNMDLYFTDEDSFQTGIVCLYSPNENSQNRKKRLQQLKIVKDPTDNVQLNKTNQLLLNTLAGSKKDKMFRDYVLSDHERRIKMGTMTALYGSAIYIISACNPIVVKSNGTLLQNASNYVDEFGVMDNRHYIQTMYSLIENYNAQLNRVYDSVISYHPLVQYWEEHRRQYHSNYFIENGGLFSYLIEEDNPYISNVNDKRFRLSTFFHMGKSSSSKRKKRHISTTVTRRKNTSKKAHTTLLIK